MTRTQHDTERHLRELTAEECWELLRGQPVGRLAWNGVNGPTVIPVNYAVVASGINVQTTPYSAAARETDDSPISFQADHVDATTRTGWSVLVHGRATIDWSGKSADEPNVDLWVSDARSLRLHLEVSEISGRRLSG